jgi:1-acyl-sn-glycerol-3-phosphate acyltransferase
VAVILIVAGLFVWAELSRRLLHNPREDVPTGIYWYFIRAYARLFHRLRAEGQEELRRRRTAGPLIVVCNHTAGIDPVLVQASLHFEARWVMAADMKAGLDKLWEFGGIIFVDREKGDLTGTREAIRHVKAGGVLGIFPEGRIERPARTLLPFQNGVGFIIRRCGAPVLPVVIEGTPDAPTAWGSIYTPGRARVRFLDLIDYSKTKLSAEEITADLQRRYQEWTGWPVNADEE